MWETWVQSLGREDPLEEEMATHSSILAWEIPWTKDPGGLQSMGSQRVGHVWATNTKMLKSYRICNYTRNQYQKIFENNPHIFESNVTFIKRLWYLKQSAQSCRGSCCSWTPIRFLKGRPLLTLCDPIIVELWEETSAGFLCKNWFHLTFVGFFWSLLAPGWVLA